jgi:hypothetical protein
MRVLQVADTAGLARYSVPGRGSARSRILLPVEIAHGFMANLLSKDPIYSSASIRGVPTDSDNANTCTCVLCRGKLYPKSN